MPELHSEIRQFLKAHALQAAAYDPEYDDPEDQYNGPDSAMMHAAAEMLANGKNPIYVHSDWGSGCYAPIGDKDAQAWHDRLVISINNMAKE